MTTFLNALVSVGRLVVYSRGIYKNVKEIASIVAGLYGDEPAADDRTEEL